MSGVIDIPQYTNNMLHSISSNLHPMKWKCAFHMNLEFCLLIINYELKNLTDKIFIIVFYLLELFSQGTLLTNSTEKVLLACPTSKRPFLHSHFLSSPWERALPPSQSPLSQIASSPPLCQSPLSQRCGALCQSSLCFCQSPLCLC